MTLRTLTFDPAQYKMVPKKAALDMRATFRRAYREGGFWSDRLDYALDTMLAAVPDTLPGVVENLAPAAVADHAQAASILNQNMQFGADMVTKYSSACNVAATLANALEIVLTTYRATSRVPQTTMQAETQLDRIRAAGGKGSDALAAYKAFMQSHRAPSSQKIEGRHEY